MALVPTHTKSNLFTTHLLLWVKEIHFLKNARGVGRVEGRTEAMGWK